MSKDAIADFLGISRATFYNKMNEDPQIEVAWHRGRATLQAKSMDWLVASAQNGSVSFRGKTTRCGASLMLLTYKLLCFAPKADRTLGSRPTT